MKELWTTIEELWYKANNAETAEEHEYYSDMFWDYHDQLLDIAHKLVELVGGNHR